MLDNFNTRVYYADYIKCETVDIPKKYFPMQYAMPVAKDFPYFDALWHHVNTLKVKNWHTGISFSVLFLKKVYQLNQFLHYHSFFTKLTI